MQSKMNSTQVITASINWWNWDKNQNTESDKNMTLAPSGFICTLSSLTLERTLQLPYWSETKVFRQRLHCGTCKEFIKWNLSESLPATQLNGCHNFWTKKPKKKVPPQKKKTRRLWQLSSAFLSNWRKNLSEAGVQSGLLSLWFLSVKWVFQLNFAKLPKFTFGHLSQQNDNYRMVGKKLVFVVVTRLEKLRTSLNIHNYWSFLSIIFIIFTWKGLTNALKALHCSPDWKWILNCLNWQETWTSFDSKKMYKSVHGCSAQKLEPTQGRVASGIGDLVCWIPCGEAGIHDTETNNLACSVLWLSKTHQFQFCDSWG